MRTRRRPECQRRAPLIFLIGPALTRRTRGKKAGEDSGTPIRAHSDPALRVDTKGWRTQRLKASTVAIANFGQLLPDEALMKITTAARLPAFHHILSAGFLELKKRI